MQNQNNYLNNPNMGYQNNYIGENSARNYNQNMNYQNNKRLMRYKTIVQNISTK